jgi:serine/threonine protein kinase
MERAATRIEGPPDKRRVIIGNRFVMENYSFPEGETFSYRQGTDLNTTELVGIRLYQKPLFAELVLHELELRQNIYHPNIVTVLGNYEDENYYYIVCHYHAGGKRNLIRRSSLSYRFLGSLMDLIATDRSRVKCHFSQILSAVNYLHQQGICFRGLQAGLQLFLPYSHEITDFYCRYDCIECSS